jgi:hypothetical protein
MRIPLQAFEWDLTPADRLWWLLLWWLLMLQIQIRVKSLKLVFGIILSLPVIVFFAYAVSISLKTTNGLYQMNQEPEADLLFGSDGLGWGLVNRRMAPIECETAALRLHLPQPNSLRIREGLNQDEKNITVYPCDDMLGSSYRTRHAPHSRCSLWTAQSYFVTYK